jgi:hypothetical protein
MKKFQRLVNFPKANRAVRAPVFIMLVAASAVTFWFASAPKALATDCMVCHKRTQTLTLTCGSLAWRRHKDHGDPDGACGATTANSFVTPERPAPSHPTLSQSN